MKNTRRPTAAWKLEALRFPLAMLAPALVACGSSDPDARNTASVAIALTAPPGTACIEETVTNLVNWQRSRDVFRLVPGEERTLELDSTPAGDIELTAVVTDAFAEDACLGRVFYEAVPQRLRLAPGEHANVTQRFLARGGLTVDATFDDGVEPDGRECSGGVPSWTDEFEGESLNGAWNVWHFYGERRNGQPTATNRIELVDGALRYLVDPMTFEGIANGYEPLLNTYFYDPGLEVTREIGGRHWLLEADIAYFVPELVNAAGLWISLDIGELPFGCWFGQYSNDDGSYPTVGRFQARCTGGDTFVESIDAVGTTVVRRVEFQRDGVELRLRSSSDGLTWTEHAATTIPDELACVPQRVRIDGSAWFDPGGAYADYRRVRFTRSEAAE